jgi:hypothetical protein
MQIQTYNIKKFTSVGRADHVLAKNEFLDIYGLDNYIYLLNDTQMLSNMFLLKRI